MPQEKNIPEEKKDEALRRYIGRLEEWPEDEPPSPAQLRAIRREIHLTPDDRDKLEILAENHIRRAQTALAGGAYDQAAAELARASQLRPMDPRPRVELAGVYLQRSLERGYGRNDRQRAVKLARKALELHPGDIEAKQFLAQYRRMNADFNSAKYRKYAIPALLILSALSLMLWWRMDWIIGLFNGGGNPESAGATVEIPSGMIPCERELPVELGSLGDGGLIVEIESAAVGRRDDSSFFDIEGTIEARDAALGSMTLMIRGRSEEGTALFAVPVPIRSGASPVLMPGDSEPLSIFRWLAVSETEISRLEISQAEADLMLKIPERNIREAEIVWDAPRPEHISVKAEIRDRTIVEAYDRQVMLMDFAVENTGTADISGLSVGLSLGSQWPDYPVTLIAGENPALSRGERRVWSMALGFPLDADHLSERPLTVRITDAGL